MASFKIGALCPKAYHLSVKNLCRNEPTRADRGSSVRPVMPSSPVSSLVQILPDVKNLWLNSKNHLRTHFRASKILAKTGSLVPTEARLFHQSYRCLRESSRAQSGKIQPARKKFRRWLKTDPETPIWVAKNRAEMPSEAPTAPRPLHYNNARKFPWHVAYKAQKFNSLFNFKNLKRRYLYAITLH